MVHNIFINTARLAVAANILSGLVLAAACGGGGGGDDGISPPPPSLTASLSGIVRDERDEAPVAGATVAVGSVTVATGTDGKFAIPNLSTGGAVVTVNASGFDPFSKNISLVTGANAVTIPLVRVNTLYTAGEFAIYVPSEVSTVRGVFFVLLGGFQDSRPMIRGDFDYYRDLPDTDLPPAFRAAFRDKFPAYRQSLMTFARAQGFAVMGMTTPLTPGGLSTDIRQALLEVSSQSSHPELAHASLVLQGHSRGGCMAYQIAVQDPPRVIGVIPSAPQGVQPCFGGQPPRSVPAYFILGELDIPAENNAATSLFEQNRGRGAIWALAIERGVGHAWTTNNTLIFNWAAAAAARRVPESITPGTPVPLLQVGEESGWLGDPASASVAGYACFTGDKLKASWLPSEQTARDWQAVWQSAGSAPTVTVCTP